MRLSVRVFGALLVLLLGVNDVAAQQVVTICGASSGYGYYLEPAGNGWTKDGISDGSLTVLRDTAGQYDVVIKSVGNSFTAKGDGAQVFRVDGNYDQRFTLVVVYPLPVTELYQFTLDQSGRGTVIWAAVKNGLLGKITKGTLFTATCSK
jgi:hypothetical protein